MHDKQKTMNQELTHIQILFFQAWHASRYCLHIHLSIGKEKQQKAIEHACMRLVQS
jgi:hypothetical protein